VVHAKKGDGGLTSKERSTLQACPRTILVTIPGTSYFIPNEEPERVASPLIDASTRQLTTPIGGITEQQHPAPWRGSAERSCPWVAGWVADECLSALFRVARSCSGSLFWLVTPG
jgi:hypothetical protein